MFCKECGRELKDGAKFCPECGTSVVKAGASAGQKQAGRADDDRQDARPHIDGRQQGGAPHVKWSKKRRVIVAAVAAIVVVVAALALAVVVSMPSDKEVEAAQDMLAVDASIDAASAPYADEAGYVDAANVKDAVNTVEKQVRAQAGSAVVQCVNDGDSVTFALSNGIHYVYAPVVKGQLGGEEAAPAEGAAAEGESAAAGEGAADDAAATGEEPAAEGEEAAPELSVVTVEPYKSEFDEVGLRSVREEKAKLCEVEGFTEGEDYANEEASIDALKTAFGQNQLVLWFGHGVSTSSDGAVLPTGTSVYDAVSDGHPLKKLSWWIKEHVSSYEGGTDEERAELADSLAKYTKYEEDLTNARIVIVKTDQDNGRLALTSRFIEEYYGDSDLGGSTFYFGSCKSLEDVVSPVEGITPFAQALVNAGASYASGYTDTVPTSFEEQTRISLVNNLVSGEDMTASLVNTKAGADGAKRAEVAKGEDEAEAIGKEKYENTYFSYVPLAEGQEHMPVIERPEDEEPADEEPADESKDEGEENLGDVSADGAVTWYEGAYNGTAPGPRISSVKLEGNTLVIKGALMRAGSKSGLEKLDYYDDPSVVDKTQTYRFKLTGKTKIEQVTSSERGTTESLSVEEFKKLSMLAAPKNVYSVDSAGNLLSIYLGV